MAESKNVTIAAAAISAGPRHQGIEERKAKRGFIL
jgi:hypothetical protein